MGVPGCLIVNSCPCGIITDMNIDNLKRELIVDDEITIKIREKDAAEATFALVNSSREYLRKYLPWVDKTLSVADCEDFIQICIDRFEKRENAGYGIYYKSELVGMVSFVSFSKSNHACEIGYWLGEQFQGKGIMTRAVKALVGDAFNDIGMHRLVIRAAIDNKSSWSIAERLGFRNEGIRYGDEMVHGKYLDSYAFSLINPNHIE
jgi:ribosomal-protein-serine acetyltransferase